MMLLVINVITRIFVGYMVGSHDLSIQPLVVLVVLQEACTVVSGLNRGLRCNL